MINEPEPVEVHCGGYEHDPDDLFGPLPGVRLDNVLAYEMAAPERFEPWPDRTSLQRTFVLLDLGVSLNIPCWRKATLRNGNRVEVPAADEGTWYVDLITVDQPDPTTFVLRDLFIDVMIPADARHHRMLDLDEFGDAIEGGKITVPQAVDALRRWQRFLDRHLHADRYPQAGWTDFPPAAIKPLTELPAPFGPPVTWPS
ncbi:DUF402 domain-containing protein [Microlunatus speluncae]|uniref:DUF402 domain-containing protein n=1 Tax=Microlunatus speluncae TaxID=2594267 RepID=UPI0012666CB1|nr:DUF402 domain-containing protein [Microlunatus speluncae]